MQINKYTWRYAPQSKSQTDEGLFTWVCFPVRKSNSIAPSPELQTLSLQLVYVTFDQEPVQIGSKTVFQNSVAFGDLLNAYLVECFLLKITFGHCPGYFQSFRYVY